jgi:hypothetical protein
VATGGVTAADAQKITSALKKKRRKRKKSKNSYGSEPIYTPGDKKPGTAY